MSLIPPLPAASDLEGMLAHRPQLLHKYRAFYLGLWEQEWVPRRVLELCRRRIAAIHDCSAELALHDPAVELSAPEQAALVRGDFSRFSPAEQVALALSERIPHNVHGIADEQVRHAARLWGNPGCVTLLAALAFMDVNCRFKQVLGVSVALGPLDKEHIR